MLTLTLKGKWFDMIASGYKKEEYREIKPYYDSRLLGLFGVKRDGDILTPVDPETAPLVNVKKIQFRNGYSADSRTFVAECKLSIGEGNPEWGAEPGVKYYVLEIVEVRMIYPEGTAEVVIRDERGSCPKCSGMIVAIVKGEIYKCNDCKTRFQVVGKGYAENGALLLPEKEGI